MLSPRWRKVLRDLSTNKVRTLLVVLSIAVGVFAVGMIAGTRVLIATDLAAAYDATNPASALLFTAAFDDDLVQAVRHVSGVRDAEGRRRATVRLQTGANTWRNLRLQALQDYDHIRLNKVEPVSGAWPPGNHELLVERNSLALTNAKVGDTVVVETPDGQQHELRVAGLIHDINNEPAQFSGTATGYVSLDTMEWLGLPRTFNELHVLVTGDTRDKQNIQAVADRVKDKVTKGGRQVSTVYIPPPGEHPATEIVNTFLLILGALGGLSLFLSGFLVVNTIMAILTQQVPQIGVMKAIGARTGQIMGMYLGAVIVYGLLSLLVAVPLGGIAAYAFTLYIASLVNFDLAGFRIPLPVLGLEVVIALVVPLLAALWPIVSGARVTVREAISAYGLGKGHFGASRFDRLLERVRGLTRPLLLSLRNTFRRKARLALTLFTLTLGGAIFIAVLTVHSSLLATLDDALNYWGYDVSVNFSQPHRVEEMQDEAMRVPGVVAAESWAGNTARRKKPDGRDSDQISILAPSADTKLIHPVILQGRWLLPDDENALVLNTEVTKQESDIKVGDEIVLKMDDRESTWRVVGIAKAVLTGPYAYANYPYFARVVRSKGRGTSVQVVASDEDPIFQASLAAALKEHFDSIGMRVRSTSAVADLRKNVEYQFNIIVVFMTIMAVLLAVVGGLGLMGTMSINVLERSREVGVMRAIGASTRSVLQIFLVEGVFIGILSWMLGALLSLPISKLLSDVVGNAFMQAPLSYTFSLNGALLWLALAFVLSVVASFLPSWRAARLTVREVLAYE